MISVHREAVAVNEMNSNQIPSLPQFSQITRCWKNFFKISGSNPGDLLIDIIDQQVRQVMIAVHKWAAAGIRVMDQDTP